MPQNVNLYYLLSLLVVQKRIINIVVRLSLVFVIMKELMSFGLEQIV